MFSEDKVVSKRKAKLAKSGFLQNGKARMSSEVLMDLKGIVNIPTKRPKNLKDQAIRCLILDYLKAEKMEHSISTFQSESGSYNDIAVEEIFTLFGIPQQNINFMQFVHHDHRSVLYCLMTSIGKQLEGENDKDAQLRTTSTQTSFASNDWNTTRHILRQNLSNIEEKHKVLPAACNFTSSSLEQHLFQFQKECESRERILMEKKLENFKRDIVTRMQMEESTRHYKEINEVKDQSRQECEWAVKALQEQLTIQKMNMEQKHLEEIHCMTKEIDSLKRKERENRNFIEMERRKLQLDEQRCKQMFKTADTKLKVIEMKEDELRETMKTEYIKCREEAKQTYEVAMETVQKQKKMYHDGLEELNALRRLSTEHLMKSELASTEASELRIQNKALQHEIEKINNELNELRMSSKISSQSAREDIKSLKSSNARLQYALDEAHRELSLLKSSGKESSRRLKEMYAEQQGRLKEAINTVERAKAETLTVNAENKELRQLLESAQYTLFSLHTTQPWIEHKIDSPLIVEAQKLGIDKSIHKTNGKKENEDLHSIIENKLIQLRSYSVTKEERAYLNDMNQNIPFDFSNQSKDTVRKCVETTQSDPDGTPRGSFSEQQTSSVFEMHDNRTHKTPADISCNACQNHYSTYETQSITYNQEMPKELREVPTNLVIPVYTILETDAELKSSPVETGPKCDEQHNRKDNDIEESYHSDFESESFSL